MLLQLHAANSYWKTANEALGALQMLSQVQTNGDCEPKAAVQDALKDLQGEFREISEHFEVSLLLPTKLPVSVSLAPVSHSHLY